ncbi:bacteriophage tail protein [Shigella sonnei]|nr:bacteriophage tail protein [Shigella sonnei]
MTGELKIGTVNALRIFNDTFGLIFRRSEDFLHFIPTAEGQGENGNIGPLRPFAINLRTGAISVSHGAKIKGGLAIGATDNALGENSIVLGDNDTGFRQDGDGIISFYSNGSRIGHIDELGLHLYKDIESNGSNFRLKSNYRHHITFANEDGRIRMFLGNDVASLATLTKVGRDILAKSTVAAVIEYLGLRELGTSGEKIPLLSTANTWTNRQTFSGGLSGELSGNASTAAKLKTARKISNVAFDGSSDITLKASHVGAFALGKTGSTVANDKAVGWNWSSGAYNATISGASTLIIHFYMGEGSCPAAQFRINYKNGGIFYRSARDGYGFEADWSEFYTTRKPSAGDVGALPLSGGQLNGALGIGTSSALGGNSIVLGDNDTGFKQKGDGNLDVYANNVHVMRFVSGSIQSNKTINITGRVNPSDYGNFDSRYVRDVRLGTRVV